MPFPSKIIFLDHKYTIKSYVCLNGKNWVCSPNLILKDCIFSVQASVVVVLVFWFRSLASCCVVGKNTCLARALGTREQGSFCCEARYPF